MGIELFTSEQAHYMCHQASCQEFAQAVSELGYRAAGVLHKTLDDKIASIDDQMTFSAASVDEAWVRRASQARSILERKRRLVCGRLEAVRSTSLAAVGGTDGLSSSRLSQVKFLLGIIDRHADLSRLTEDDRAAIDACRAAAGQTVDPKFTRFRYNPVTNSILTEDRVEVAVLSRRGCDREEFGTLLAASATLLADVEMMYPSFADADPAGAAAVKAHVAQLR